MNAPSRPTGPSDTPDPTLGALLYADPHRVHPSEEEWVALVRSIAAGDQTALHELYQRTHRIAFTLIMRIVQDRPTAEELTLDVFHDVWRRRASAYDPADGSVVGWIMNHARSRAIDRHRFDRRLKRVDPRPATSLDASAEDSSNSIDAHDRAERLHLALAQLSAEERSAIETAFFSGLTHVEAAARLGQPLGTLKTRIRTGLGKLRAELTKGDREP